MANIMQPTTGQPYGQAVGVNALQQRQQQQPQQASFWKGSPGQWSQQDLYNPQQNQAIQQIIQQALGGLQNPTQGFEPFAQSARQNFQENTLPSILERFTSLGKGAQSSGAFQGLVGRAGADLESGLAQGASQFGQQQQGLWQQLLGMGLRPTQENVYKPREASGWEALMPHIIEALGHVGAAVATGGASAPGSAVAYGSKAFNASKKANYSTRGGF